ncbi:N-6 DNA methylase [Proteinivorax hydrogeniformans]|uniref:site-specific DNA-methyltransferase (adenine-specific) n=1 Tax=Proteinivorax hydrogeniformans TaxID=1826727 RepID=A0AAU8HTS6_9FIRM
MKQNIKSININDSTLKNWLRAWSLEEPDDLDFNKVLKNKLKSRRNKVLKTSYEISSNYSQCKKTVEAANKLFGTFQRNRLKVIHIDRKILLITSAILLKKRGLIQCINKAIHTPEKIEDKNIAKLMIGFNVFFSAEDSKVLTEALSTDLPYTKGEDILGMLYSSFKTEGKKSEQGFYLTPKKVRELVVKRTFRNLSNQTVLDPCCGTGAFLLEAYQYNQFESSDIEKLAGIELDSIAALLCKINLLLIQGKGYKMPNIIQADFLDTNLSKRFGVVIGNPPWGGKVSSQIKADSFKLFLEKGISLLKPGGTIGFLLPYSYLIVSKHKESRKRLINCHTIQSITHFKNAFEKVMSEAVLLIISKRYPQYFHRVSIYQENNKETYLQNRFMDNDSAVNILTTPPNHNIRHKLKQNCIYLKENVDYGMGIVTGDNQRFLSKDKLEGEPIITGKEVFKYQLKDPSFFINFSLKNCFQQVAPEQLYRQAKLVYRFINKNLVFALDRHGVLTLNSVNFLIPDIKGYDIRFILAVLNSKAAQMYFQQSYCSIKVLKSQIQSIPIPRCNLSEQKPIIEMVDSINYKGDKTNSLYFEVEKLIHNLYGLNKWEKEIIDKQIDVKYLSS